MPRTRSVEAAARRRDDHPLTAGQADAVAQLYLNGNQEFINRFNFLDPAAPFFDDAIDWAIEYVLINGQSTLDDIVDVDRSTLGN